MGAGSSSERRRRQSQNVQTVPQRQQQSPPQPQHQQRPPSNYPAQQGAPRQAQPAVQHMPPQQQQQPVQQQQQAPHHHHAPAVSPTVQAGVSEATSIKNECTIMVETIKYDATHSLLSFQTNCNIPCEVEVHVAVRVDVMHGNAMITPNKPKPPPPKIPVAAGHNVSHEVPIDLTNVTEQEMMFLNEYPRQFPVVVALYYTCPDDKTNHCAEYTMVQLKPAGKYVKQLLRNKQGVFKIENLFGGEHADVGTVVSPDHGSPQSGGVGGGESPAPEGMAAGVVDDDDEDGLCVICLTNEKNTVVLPCRHLCLCKECAEELRNRGPKCPVCRGPLNQLVSVRS